MLDSATKKYQGVFICEKQYSQLAIWMNGGPGTSSMVGLFAENGPCFVNIDSNSTTLNPWSWNNEVNMLYIDQPVQTGFSYDELVNGTVDIITGEMAALADGAAIPEQDLRQTLVGTFPSMNSATTLNTTDNAAKAVWHFLQAWLEEFPEHMPGDGRISLFSESYGGHYGPAFAEYFEAQNALIANGSIKKAGENTQIHLDTLGIVNGCLDPVSETFSYLSMYSNNTYGLQLTDPATAQDEFEQFFEADGCLAGLNACEAAAEAGDPENAGYNETVNEICADVQCAAGNGFMDSGERSIYDIAAQKTTSLARSYYIGFLNQHWVQKALGVPLNFTQSMTSVSMAFTLTGDYSRDDQRGGYRADLAKLLDSGVKVAMMYGDRDFVCNVSTRFCRSLFSRQVS